MKSLRELNQTSLLQVTFEDDRPSGVEFYPDPPQANLFVDITENSEFFPETGTNITSIVDYQTAQVKYKLDFSSWSGQVDVDWEDILPTHPTISYSEISPNVWEIIGIDSDSVWNVVKSPKVQSPFGLDGVQNFTSTISYYDTSGTTLLTKTWSTEVTIQSVTYMDQAPDQHFVPYSLDNAIPTPQIIVSTIDFEPTFTLTIIPSVIDSIENITVTTPDSAVFNSATDQLTIVGEKDEINDALATMEIDFGPVNENFTLTYRLTNDLNPNVEIVTQDFESDGELASGFTVLTQITSEAKVFHLVKGGANTLAETTVRSGLQRVTLGESDIQSNTSLVATPWAYLYASPVEQASIATIPLVDSAIISQAWTAPATTTNDFYANTLDQQVDNFPSLTNVVRGDWTVNIGPDINDTTAIAGIQEISTTSTLPTKSYNSSTATLTLIGSSTEIQDAIDNLLIDYNNSNKADWDLYFVAEYNNAGTLYTYQHSMQYLPSILSPNGTYLGNQENTPFGIFEIVEPNYTSWSLTLSVNTGDMLVGSNVVKSTTLTGTSTEIQDALNQLEYYPDYNQTSDAIVTFSSSKDGRTSDNGTVSLVFTSVGTIGNTAYELNINNTSYTPSLREYRYGQMSYAVVGGGGGAARSYVQPSDLPADLHTITNHGNVYKDTAVYNLSGGGGTSASGAFPGNTGDYLSWDYQSSFFSKMSNVSFYFRLDSVTGTQVLMETHKTDISYPNFQWSIKVQANNDDLEVVIADPDPEGSGTTTKSFTNILTADTWHHFWFVADKKGFSDTYTYGIYLDGTRFALNETNYIPEPGDWKATLGADRNGNNLITGYIDEFCVGPALFQADNNGVPPTTLSLPNWSKWAAEPQNSYPNLSSTGNGEILHIDFNFYSEFDEIIDDRSAHALIIDSNALALNPYTGGGGQVIVVENATVENTTYTATLGLGGLSGFNRHFKHGVQGQSSVFRTTTALGGGGAHPVIQGDPDFVYYYATANGATFRSSHTRSKGGDYGGYNDGLFTGGAGGFGGVIGFDDWAPTGGGPGDAYNGGNYEDGYPARYGESPRTAPLPTNGATFSCGATIGRLSGAGVPILSQNGLPTMQDPPEDEQSVIQVGPYATGTIWGKGADSNHTKGQPGAVSIVIHPK